MKQFKWICGRMMILGFALTAFNAQAKASDQPLAIPAPQCGVGETPYYFQIQESTVALTPEHPNLLFLVISGCESHSFETTHPTPGQGEAYDRSSTIGGTAYVGWAPRAQGMEIRPVGEVKTAPFAGTYYERKFFAHGNRVTIRNASEDILVDGDTYSGSPDITVNALGFSTQYAN